MICFSILKHASFYKPLPRNFSIYEENSLDFSNKSSTIGIFIFFNPFYYLANFAPKNSTVPSKVQWDFCSLSFRPIFAYSYFANYIASFLLRTTSPSQLIPIIRSSKYPTNLYLSLNFRKVSSIQTENSKEDNGSP